MWRVIKFLLTGYWNVPGKKCADCKSLWESVPSSPLCWDARCRYHCDVYCECEGRDRHLAEVRRPGR